MENTLCIDSNYSLLSTPEDYAEAAITLNPRITWLKFVFTDDQPNKNKQRISQAEFDNVIRSGVNMPIKKEPGNIEGQHALSVPVGVITNLTKQDNKVIGLGALWKEEFPNEVKALSEAHANGKPLNLSWEIYYSDSSKDENGVEDLTGTNVRAITFVGLPAYEGRTNVVAMAEINKPTTSQEDDELENSKDVDQKVTELEKSLAEINTKFTEATSSLEAANKELETLRQYKTDREAADTKAKILTNRKKALVEAGIKMSDEDFLTKSEYIAGMNEEVFAFFVQELVAFAAKRESSAETHTNGNNAPDLSLNNDSSESVISVLKSAFAPEPK